MSKLQIPPDIAMQRQMQQMQVNQLYTLAAQIYIQSIATTERTVDVLARESIIAAEVFIAEVTKHAKMQKEEKSNG